MRFDLLEAYGLDPEIIHLLKEKYGPDLLPIQEKAFKEHQILAGGNFIIFAVTSAGKTLVGEILSLFNAGKGKRVFYLVPTKALAEEKFEQFNEDYQKAGIKAVISTHDRREFDQKIQEGNFHIAVIVYEKLHALLVKNPKLISEVGLIVIDELQYISEEERGAALEILLTKILLAPDAPQLVGLMAFLAQWPGEVVTRDEIYSHLWPDHSNPHGSGKPYDRQISDHKRKITAVPRAPQFQIRNTNNHRPFNFHPPPFALGRLMRSLLLSN